MEFGKPTSFATKILSVIYSARKHLAAAMELPRLADLGFGQSTMP
jgi:hypothetical protein